MNKRKGKNMGVKYGREYLDILHDLQKILVQIEGIHLFFEMSDEEWGTLSEQQQMDCLQTVADDIFYGLGKEPTLQIGNATITYYPNRHMIFVNHPTGVDHIISLIES